MATREAKARGPMAMGPPSPGKEGILPFSLPIQTPPIEVVLD